MSLQEILDSVIPSKVSETSISIVAFDTNDKVLHQFGTGTLLRIADDSFLVTAAHIATQAKELSKSLCIGVDETFIQLHGNWCLSSENSPYDIAALRLPLDITKKLSNLAHVRLQDVDFSLDLSNGVFCLLGYPGRLSITSTPDNTTMSVTPFQFLTHAYTGKTENLGNYQPKFHLLLSAQDGGVDNEGSPIKFSDRNNTPLNFPKDLGGISGCSIWKVGEQNKPIREWKSYRPKIVAVQTGVYSEAQVIKGTRWIAVSTLLYEAYEDLREVIKLIRVEH